MIGNDIIDLKLAKQESNWQRKGYLDKLFSADEQTFIFNAKNQSQMVWVLWSIKESVYKAHIRMVYNRGFYPLKIEVTALYCKENIFYSKTTLFNQSFNGKTTVSHQIIHSIVTHSDYEINKIIFLKSDIQYFKNSKGLPVDISNKNISVSHHGIYKRIITYP